MKSAKRCFLIAAIVAVPFATASCKIPLADGCTYEIYEPHYVTAQLGQDAQPRLWATYNTGEVC